MILITARITRSPPEATRTATRPAQALEPAVLGIDIVFDGIREDTVANQRLLEVVRQQSTTPPIWAFKLTEWSKEQEQFTQTFHSFFVDSVAVEEGFTNVRRDVNGGTVRSFGLQRIAGGDIQYSLPAKVATAFTRDSSIINRQTDCTICYSAAHFPVVPCDSIFQYADLITGHIVLLGATHDQRDLHYTPIGRIAGLQVLAYTVQTLIERKIPVEIPFWHTICITFFLIWLGQLCQYGFIRYLTKRPYETLQYIGKNGLAASIVSFIFMCLLVGLSFFHRTPHQRAAPI